MQEKNWLIEIKNLNKTFSTELKSDLLVLDNINLNIAGGEIIAILGRSGSGKSTLLRIIAGLISPTSGSVLYEGKPVYEPIQGMAMIFQNFALMPWLTVLQNVELGLEALGVTRHERRQRALQAIDMIGLDGFESAFPKELSGGMRQRVGFARAIVVNPNVLLMDEPFSALDVLTADNLRSDLLDLWLEHKTNIKSIVFVTHKIEEAISMADRILIFDSSPGRIKMEISMADFPQPRSEQSEQFIELTSQIYALLTLSRREKEAEHEKINIDSRLPSIEVSELIGLMEALVDEPKQISLQELSELLHLEEESLLPLVEMSDILHFVSLSKGNIKLTKMGREFAESNILDKKQIFAQQLLLYVPLAAYVKRILNEKRSHTERVEIFMGLLEEYFGEEDAERVFKTIIELGRYGEIFAFNSGTGELSLENP